MAEAAITSADFTTVLTNLQAQISVSTIVEVLGVGATAAIGMVFMWWGVRKLAAMLMAAFRKGRIRI